MKKNSLKKIIIDPVTRIEGHLRIEVEIDENNVIQEAWASGQLFRGIETILVGKDPRDTALVAQRICGVCTHSHYRASIESVEDAYKMDIPRNAHIMRNLVSLSLFIQDHIVHYYQLHSLDFVDVVSASQAKAKKATQEALKYSAEPYRNSKAHLKSVKEKLVNFIKAGRLGLFANGYWGHEGYKFTPEQNLIHMSHYFEALRIQREISKAIAIFAGKTPHPQYLVVGGVTSVMDMLNSSRLNDFMLILKEVNDFINRAYLPDVKMLCEVYKEDIHAGNGLGVGNFMAVGGYDFSKENQLFEAGVIKGFDFENIESFDITNVTEEATRAWYVDEKAVFPIEGSTTPFYTDINEDGSLKTSGKYSWIKAPRYEGVTMEVGPVSRMLVGYLKNSPVIKPYMDTFLQQNDLELKDICTTIGRNIARAIEANICCEFIFDFMNELIENIKYYDEQTWSKYSFDTLPKNAQGWCVYEVPRGVLAHFVNIENQKVKNYQAVVPTTWNASPKDAKNQRGPYEESLIGIKLNNPKEPLEVLRVIHSFDPCLACAVHIIDAKKSSLGSYKVGTSIF
ncbi:MAG: nickel-dependent hydrogenase large subunit [Candidatus Marinarcus sp.]|uniref:nickel-dependent hydrogenase large subunit n=1 Tax=Candidatus Marinarcus sp. TaxID=3100987 RepID=UPI003B008A45